MVKPMRTNELCPMTQIWGKYLKPVGLFWYSSEIILCKSLSALPTLRLGESHQFMRKSWVAWPYVVLCKNFHLVHCLGLQALELILGDGDILDFHINVLVFILALNLVTDDNRRNGITVQDCPRDHSWGICDVEYLDVFGLRREN